MNEPRTLYSNLLQNPLEICTCAALAQNASSSAELPKTPSVTHRTSLEITHLAFCVRKAETASKPPEYVGVVGVHQQTKNTPRSPKQTPTAATWEQD